MPAHDTIVIGAGLAGLTCALELRRRGLQVCVLEAADAVGGRVRTDEHEGFLLDRGFQVLLTAYPHAKRYLDYEALELEEFFAGALIYTGRSFEKVADPVRHPVAGVQTLLAKVGTRGDKLRIGRMRARLLTDTLDKIYAREDDDTLTWLRDQGFSEEFIDQFFRPFYGGVMLDDELETSSKMLEFTYKMFSDGATALPTRGMGALPEQLADQIGRGRIRLGARVRRMIEGGVELEGGERLEADQVVLATEVDFAAEQRDELEAKLWRSVSCLYFAAPEPPIEEPILVLNGEREAGPVNNLCVPSQVAPSYAPAGQALVSASVLGRHDHEEDEALEGAVRDQLSSWFGAAEVSNWRHLRTYHIERAQPDQRPGELDPVARPVRLSPGRYVCGDHRETSSIEGAMRSGRRAAEAVVEDREGS